MGLFDKKAEKRQHDYDVDILEREQAFNAQQAQVAYDRQREFYQMQFNQESAYNSPLSQMQRYRQAGLSPGLMQYGEGNTSVSASSPASASASGSNTVNMAALQSNKLQAIQSVSQFLNEYQKIQSEVDLNKTAAAKNVAEADKIAGVDTEKTRADISNTLADTEFKKAQEVKTVADTELSRTQKENVAQQTENLSYTLEHILPKQSKEIEENIRKIGQDIENSQQITKATCAELYQNILESVSRIDVNNRQADLLWKQINSFDEKLAAELDVSRATFQQLKLGNSRQEQVNDMFTDFVKGTPLIDMMPDHMFKHMPESWKQNMRQFERYYKMHQLNALNLLNLNVLK